MADQKFLRKPREISDKSDDVVMDVCKGQCVDYMPLKVIVNRMIPQVKEWFLNVVPCRSSNKSMDCLYLNNFTVLNLSDNSLSRFCGLLSNVD